MLQCVATILIMFTYKAKLLQQLPIGMDEKCCMHQGKEQFSL